MPERCSKCTGPATAGANPLFPERSRCVACASVTNVSIPANLERLADVPDSIANGPAWPIASAAAQGKTLWLHQANALRELERGRNIVVATSTASGKSLIFQTWTLHRLKQDPKATALVFYPTKALANDQARRWQECCETLKMDPKTVGQVDGDVKTDDRRKAVMEKSRIIIATPDICHTWILKESRNPSVRRYLRQLSVLIIDEAHTYESVFGSNSAYLFRRLTAAALNAGAPNPPRIIAATATIQEPAEHLEKLTGLPFTVISDEQNGSPRYVRNLYHLPLDPRGGSAETQMAQLVKSIIDNDPKAQVIAFHDSRQGVERISLAIGRPRQVLAYRSGYLPQDRRDIETKLRNNTIRAVITTSALELGIDMQELNYGVQMDLPPSRKQFHQRLGRVGRSQPGAFIILAPAGRFTTYGDTLREYYENSVEPSRLFLDNEYINYQQSECLKDELKKSGRDTRVLPKETNWPSGFEEALKNAHHRPPVHLQALAGRRNRGSPQTAHMLRSTGEESLEIRAKDDDNGPEENIGNISISTAMDEAYPGAVYHHGGISYRIREWARSKSRRNAFIRAERIKKGGKGTTKSTKPILRRTATVPQDTGCIINQRPMHDGHITEMKLLVTESVEGYEGAGEGIVLYLNETLNDPRLSRKQREMPTTAVHLRIEEPWFAGEIGEPWQARTQIAQALRLHLAYEKSIALPDLGCQVENLFMETPAGYVELHDSIIIHDNIHGGMGLVGDLYKNIGQYARNLKMSGTNEPGTVDYQYAGEFVRWLGREEPAPDRKDPEPGDDNWWRVVRTGSEVRVFSKRKNAMVKCVVKKCEWRDGIFYLVNAIGKSVMMRDKHLKPTGSALDWELWQPSTDSRRELHFIR